MLYDPQWMESGQTDLKLSETGECETVFDRFLRYLYKAEIDISTSTAVGILCLADKYNVSSLKLLCVEYMIRNTRSPLVQNGVEWYSWAKALHLPSLQQQCAKTIAWPSLHSEP